MALALMPWSGREAITGINKTEGQRVRYVGEVWLLFMRNPINAGSRLPNCR